MRFPLISHTNALPGNDIWGIEPTPHITHMRILFTYFRIHRKHSIASCYHVLWYSIVILCVAGTKRNCGALMQRQPHYYFRNNCCRLVVRADIPVEFGHLQIQQKEIFSVTIVCPYLPNYPQDQDRMYQHIFDKHNALRNRSDSPWIM